MVGKGRPGPAKGSPAAYRATTILRTLMQDPQWMAVHKARYKLLHRPRLKTPDIEQKRRLKCSLAMTDYNNKRKASRAGRRVQNPHLVAMTSAELADYRVLMRKGYKKNEALRAVGRADLVT